LPISSTQEIHKSEYLTAIVLKNVLITIINEENETLDELENENDNNPIELKVSIYLLIYFMASEILRVGMDNEAKLRKKINDLAVKMFVNPEQISIN
jgi:hypothetical protein